MSKYLNDSISGNWSFSQMETQFQFSRCHMSNYVICWGSLDMHLHQVLHDDLDTKIITFENLNSFKNIILSVCTWVFKEKRTGGAIISWR